MNNYPIKEGVTLKIGDNVTIKNGVIVEGCSDGDINCFKKKEPTDIKGQLISINKNWNTGFVYTRNQ
tara:strand:+ start:32 stop:232 length:201 start_codon:yes stop_codon:yes gene_type:complete